MLAQYRGIKTRYPDAVVLVRLGDFYEMFEADAKIGARELELALTGRSFAKMVRLAMAGVPHHHVQSYIAKLIERGYKVAVVEQLEDPRRVNKLVKGDVVRIISPGTVAADALLHAKQDNYLASLVRAAGAHAFHGVLSLSFGLALLDISTGEFAVAQVDIANLKPIQALNWLNDLQLRVKQMLVRRINGEHRVFRHVTHY